MSNGTLRALVLIFTILYLISPVDGFPGPIDDIIVALMALAAQRNLQS